MKTPAIIALALAAAAFTQAAAADRVFHRDPSLPAELPFSAAVVVGDTIYLSGQIGLAAEGDDDAANDIASQTRRIFERYKKTLAELGSGLDDIVKCTVFLDDMNDYAAMNAAYAEAFPENKPARSTLGADGLALGAAVEIECLAVKR